MFVAKYVLISLEKKRFYVKYWWGGKESFTLFFYHTPTFIIEQKKSNVNNIDFYRKLRGTKFIKHYYFDVIVAK